MIVRVFTFLAISGGLMSLDSVFKCGLTHQLTFDVLNLGLRLRYGAR